ncbi:MAG: ArsR family transcriptional regulator [Nitrosotalea sp.]
MSWNDVSYVIASKTRKAVLLKLETPRTPTFLSKELNVNLANISRGLAELEGKNIVVCLTPNQKVGKIYTLTKKGNDIISKIKVMEKS